MGTERHRQIRTTTFSVVTFMVLSIVAATVLALSMFGHVRSVVTQASGAPGSGLVEPAAE